MTRGEIFEFLKNMPLPNLKQMSKWYKENINPSDDVMFFDAGDRLAALNKLERIVHPDKKDKRPNKSRAFYDAMHYPNTLSDRQIIEKAMLEAGVKKWKEMIPILKNPEKNGKYVDWQNEIFMNGASITLTLNRSSNSRYYGLTLAYETDADRYHSSRLPEDSPWRWIPSPCRISNEFLDKLESDTALASTLAANGYQNVVTFDDQGDGKLYVAFIKLPRSAHLERTPNPTWGYTVRLHNLCGPAYVSCSGIKEWAIHGVYLSKYDFERFFDGDTGTLKAKARDIITLPNTELRRSLMMLYDKDKLLEDCDAQLIDKSVRGNELYQVDIGLPSVWRNGKSNKQLAKVLRFTCPSTGRVYVEFVPPDETSADDAMAKSLHMNPGDYQNLTDET